MTFEINGCQKGRANDHREGKSKRKGTGRGGEIKYLVRMRVEKE